MTGGKPIPRDNNEAPYLIKLNVRAWECREGGEMEITVDWGYWNLKRGAERMRFSERMRKQALY